MGWRDIGSFSLEAGFMGWKEVLVARIVEVTEGVLGFEAVEPDLPVLWCKGWGYMGMLMGGSAMLIAIDGSSYVRDKCIPIVVNDCERTRLLVNNVCAQRIGRSIEGQLQNLSAIELLRN